MDISRVRIGLIILVVVVLSSVISYVIIFKPQIQQEAPPRNLAGGWPHAIAVGDISVFGENYLVYNGTYAYGGNIVEGADYLHSTRGRFFWSDVEDNRYTWVLEKRSSGFGIKSSHRIVAEGEQYEWAWIKILQDRNMMVEMRFYIIVKAVCLIYYVEVENIGEEPVSEMVLGYEYTPSGSPRGYEYNFTSWGSLFSIESDAVKDYSGVPTKFLMMFSILTDNFYGFSFTEWDNDTSLENVECTTQIYRNSSNFYDCRAENLSGKLVIFFRIPFLSSGEKSAMSWVLGVSGNRNNCLVNIQRVERWIIWHFSLVYERAILHLFNWDFSGGYIYKSDSPTYNVNHLSPGSTVQLITSKVRNIVTTPSPVSLRLSAQAQDEVTAKIRGVDALRAQPTGLRTWFKSGWVEVDAFGLDNIVVSASVMGDVYFSSIELYVNGAWPWLPPPPSDLPPVRLPNEFLIFNPDETFKSLKVMWRDYLDYSVGGWKETPTDAIRGGWRWTDGLPFVGFSLYPYLISGNSSYIHGIDIHCGRFIPGYLLTPSGDCWRRVEDYGKCLVPYTWIHLGGLMNELTAYRATGNLTYLRLAIFMSNYPFRILGGVDEYGRPWAPHWISAGQPTVGTSTVGEEGSVMNPARAEVMATWAYAVLNLYECTGDLTYLNAAEKVADFLIERNQRPDRWYAFDAVWPNLVDHDNWFHDYSTLFPIHFLLDIYEVTRNERYLESARKAMDHYYINHLIGELNWPKMPILSWTALYVPKLMVKMSILTGNLTYLEYAVNAFKIAYEDKYIGAGHWDYPETTSWSVYSQIVAVNFSEPSPLWDQTIGPTREITLNLPPYDYMVVLHSPTEPNRVLIGGKAHSDWLYNSATQSLLIRFTATTPTTVIEVQYT